MKARRPLLVAIVGGSGSGKTWLAKKLQAKLGRRAVRLSLDDFYRDRSHVPDARRGRINFDNPRAIDWECVERVLRDVVRGRAAELPCYDFKTHCRLSRAKTLQPRPVVLVEGLWLLHRRSLQGLFDLRVFIRCSTRSRLRRRLARDRRARGRTEASIRAQFWKTVAPMHERFVAPQESLADVVLNGDFGAREINRLAARLRGPVPGATARDENSFLKGTL